MVMPGAALPVAASVLRGVAGRGVGRVFAVARPQLSEDLLGDASAQLAVDSVSVP
jgi:hypothetical protein